MTARTKHALFAFVASMALAGEAYPCSIIGKISNLKLVGDADVIVRAKAVEYASQPTDPNTFTTGVPDSKIRFKVLETIRGPVDSELILPGYLVDHDDFNDHPSPYEFVRPGGRAGSCFANSYRKGQQFLLFLKKNKAGQLTPNWYALAPVNEQLHSDDDVWVVWVRQHAKVEQRKD